MKRKRLAAYICICCVAVVLLLAGFIIKTGWNSRIEIPSADMAQMIEMELRSNDAGDSVAITSNKTEINVIISELSKGRKASVTSYSAANDVTYADEYLKVLIQAERESTTLYIIFERNRYYVYAPYVGVYRIDQKTGWNIHQVFVGLQPKTQPANNQ